MTNRKTALATVFLMLLVALSTAVQGQTTTSTTTTNTPRTPSLTGLTTALDLTAAQVSQLQTLLQAQAPAIQTLFNNLRTAQQSLQTALKSNDTASITTANQAVQTAQTALTSAQTGNQQALLAVLTTSQQQIIKDYLLIAQNGGPGPFGAGPGFGGGPGPRGGGPGLNGMVRGGPRP
jgi:hypothetical protein